MTIVAEHFTFVVGVDTHARSNTYAIIATRTAARLDAATFPASPPGISRALSWILRRCQGGEALLVIEGIGSYGAAIGRAAASQGLEVVEPMAYGSPRRRGPKDDTIDAELIARSVLGVDEALLRRPRADDPVRTGLRVLVVAREDLNSERTRFINALTALVPIVDLGLDARRQLGAAQLQFGRDRLQALGPDPAILQPLTSGYVCHAGGLLPAAQSVSVDPERSGISPTVATFLGELISHGRASDPVPVICRFEIVAREPHFRPRASERHFAQTSFRGAGEVLRPF